MQQWATFQEKFDTELRDTGGGGAACERKSDFLSYTIITTPRAFSISHINERIGASIQANPQPPFFVSLQFNCSYRHHCRGVCRPKSNSFFFYYFLSFFVFFSVRQRYEAVPVDDEYGREAAR